MAWLYTFRVALQQEVAPTPGSGESFDAKSVGPSVPKSKWALLGGMRFFLASIVAATHLHNVFGSRTSEFIGSAAFEAIIGFLAISGFSIANSYHRDPMGYLKRRAERILPVYWACIALALGALFLLNEPMPRPITLVWNLLFLNGAMTPVSVVGPSWTLSVEVWLYALAPLFNRLSFLVLRLITYGSLLFFAAYSFLRSAKHLPYYAGTIDAIGLFALAYAWICGWNLAGYRDAKRTVARTDLWIAMIATVAVRVGVQAASALHRHSPSDLAHALPEDAWSLAILVLAGLCLQAGDLNIPQRTQNVLRYLGDISYPLYLSHITVFQLIKQFQPETVPLVAYLVSLLVSVAILFVFDRYTINRERRAAKLPSHTQA
jgi:peptidoglycan/LPS O-acetylase OafA/YrhL